MAGLGGPPMPTSPSGISAMQRVTRLEVQMQTMQQDQGTFASQTNQAQMVSDARMGTIESTIRGSQEAIRIEFDRAAAQRAAQFASLIADATDDTGPGHVRVTSKSKTRNR